MASVYMIQNVVIMRLMTKIGKNLEKYRRQLINNTLLG